MVRVAHGFPLENVLLAQDRSNSAHAGDLVILRGVGTLAYDEGVSRRHEQRRRLAGQAEEK